MLPLVQAHRRYRIDGSFFFANAPRDETLLILLLRAGAVAESGKDRAHVGRLVFCRRRAGTIILISSTLTAVISLSDLQILPRPPVFFIAARTDDGVRVRVQTSRHGGAAG